MYDMYDSGRTINLGTAEATILGIANFGMDPDGADFPQQFEFEADPIDL